NEVSSCGCSGRSFMILLISGTPQPWARFSNCDLKHQKIDLSSLIIPRRREGATATHESSINLWRGRRDSNPCLYCDRQESWRQFSWQTGKSGGQNHAEFGLATHHARVSLVGLFQRV